MQLNFFHCSVLVSSSCLVWSPLMPKSSFQVHTWIVYTHLSHIVDGVAPLWLHRLHFWKVVHIMFVMLIICHMPTMDFELFIQHLQKPTHHSFLIRLQSELLENLYDGFQEMNIFLTCFSFFAELSTVHTTVLHYWKQSFQNKRKKNKLFT